MSSPLLVHIDVARENLYATDFFFKSALILLNLLYRCIGPTLLLIDPSFSMKVIKLSELTVFFKSGLAL